jgi:cytochrome oxidase Cu insertion factor (SCO1/SenC/PrrC family)
MSATALPLPDRNAGRRMLLLLVAALALPFILAAALILSGWRPAAAPHHGELLPQSAAPAPLSLDALAIRAGPEKSALAGRWLLVAVEPGACETACAQRLDSLRRVHVALYKAMPRVKRVLLAARAPAVEQPDLTVAAGWPGLMPAHVYLVDPEGRAVLRYAANDFLPKAMLKDIERLLRYSWTG